MSDAFQLVIQGRTYMCIRKRISAGTEFWREPVPIEWAPVAEAVWDKVTLMAFRRWGEEVNS